MHRPDRVLSQICTSYAPVAVFTSVGIHDAYVDAAVGVFGGPELRIEVEVFEGRFETRTLLPLPVVLSAWIAPSSARQLATAGHVPILRAGVAVDQPDPSGAVLTGTAGRESMRPQPESACEVRFSIRLPVWTVRETACDTDSVRSTSM